MRGGFRSAFCKPYWVPQFETTELELVLTLDVRRAYKYKLPHSRSAEALHFALLSSQSISAAHRAPASTRPDRKHEKATDSKCEAL